MSLRAKLYFGFFFMVFLVVFTGGMALRAFWRTNVIVEDTRQQVSNVNKILVPANQLVKQVYTDVNQATLSIRAYSFNRMDKDYEEAINNIGQIRNRMGMIEEIVKQPHATMLSASLTLLQTAKSDVEAIDVQAKTLKESMARTDRIQKSVDESLGQMKANLDDLYERTLTDVEAQFADKDAVGMTPLRGRIMAAWGFLDNLYNTLTAIEVELWRGRGKFGQEAAEIFKSVDKKLAEQSDVLKNFIATAGLRDSEVRAKYDSLNTHLETYQKHVNDFSYEWARSTVINDAVAQTASKLLDTFDNLDLMTTELSAQNVESAYEGTVSIDIVVSSSITASFIILAIAVVIGALLAILITRGIVTPINAVIVSLSHGEEVIGEAAAHISAAAHDLSESVTEQAASLEETSSALEQVSSMTKASAQNAGNTNANTRKTADLIKSGASDMKEMSDAMVKINGQADRISNIIKTIEEIAFQTNLLALNAAVEAARAGEAGKGFAVVADEVRNLSGRSAQAAKDTAELITATVESVRSGSGILQRLSGSYGEIETGIDSIGDLIGQIANAADEQSQGVDQINTSVSQMGRLTQQNAAGATESAASVGNLEEQINDLRGNIVSLRGIITGQKTQRSLPAPGKGGNGRGGKIAPPSRQLTGGAMVVDPDMME